MNTINPIGVFDSGLGGISVLQQLQKDMPHEHFLYVGDSAFAPYGTKDKEAIIERCITICDYFMEHHAKAIVVACNTATSAAIQILRDTYPIPIIGMEPALKLAAHNKHNQNIVVMATPLTLKEEKFANLMSSYDSDNTIIKVPCPELVEMVESNRLHNQDEVLGQLQSYFQHIDIKKIDSIVLGCTHFVFYKPYFEKFYANITIFDGNEGTSHHVKDILEKENHLIKEGKGSIHITNTANKEEYITLSHSLLNETISL